MRQRDYGAGWHARDDEIERLRSQWEGERACAAKLFHEVGELGAEVKRLREALVEAKSLAIDYRDGLSHNGFRGSRQQIALHIDAALDKDRDVK